MRVTVVAPNVYTEFGISAPIGSTITVGDDYGASLVWSLKAIDTDGVLSEPGNRPFDQVPPQSPVSGVAITVGSSRALTSADDGKIIECTTTVTLTVPASLPSGFACVVIPSGTTSVASSGGALLNGATTTLTRAAASNAMFAIQSRASAVDSYVVSGS